MKKHIPNTITSLNLFVGCVAVYLAFTERFDYAFYSILLAAVLDFLDGFAARILKAYSNIGKELDSLADVISFGLAPGAIVFTFIMQTDLPIAMRYLGFLIPVFSALRLAKFNIDERQTSSFLGLPTPANAIFWGGAVYAFKDLFIAYPYILCALTVLFSLLLVSEIPMFSLKFKSSSWSQNKTQYIFLFVCIVFFVLMKMDAFAPIIAFYIVFSILLYLFCGKKEGLKKQNVDTNKSAQ